MNGLTIGIVGCGSMGLVHLGNFVRMKGVGKVCAFDMSESRLAKARRLYGVSTISDYQQLLKEVDAVCIATPNSLHYSQSIEAIRAGRHVLVEKPLATTSIQAARLAQEAIRRHLILAVGTQKRFNPEYINLRQEVKNGILGQPVLIKARMVGEGPRRFRKSAIDWYFAREKGGGALFDLGSHMIDLVQWVYPHSTPTVLGGSLGRILDMPVEEYAFCLLKADRNTVISIEVGWFTTFHDESLEVIGTMGERIARDTRTMKDWVLSRFGSSHYDGSGHYWQDQAFTASCLKNTYVGSLATGTEGANCIATIERIYSVLDQKERL